MEDANNLKQQELAEEGKRHLDNCEYQKAVEVLEKIDTKDPDMLFAKNNLALSYYCMKKNDEAIRITQKFWNAIRECTRQLQYGDVFE